MKRSTMTTTLIAAAALTAVAGGASAQTTMKAEIPFTFQAGGAVLAPGNYTLRMSAASGSRVFTLHNLDSGKSAMVVQGIDATAPKHWRADGQARLGFLCGGTRCALTEVWGGGAERAYYFAPPKAERSEAAR